MLRLVATTKTIYEICCGVDGLFWDIGVETKCSFHKLSDQATNENRLQVTSQSEIDGAGKSENEILGDLQFFRSVLVSNVTPREVKNKDCNCKQLVGDSLLLIPALSSPNGLSWIKIQMPSMPNLLHISEAFIECLQWTFFLQVERDLLQEVRDLNLVSNSSHLSTFQLNVNLTMRQNRIVQLVLEGMTNHEIGIQLHISTSLVKMELGKVFRTLGISNRKELYDPPRF
jgi:DNA-binding CsgD family transcriptional regulator